MASSGIIIGICCYFAGMILVGYLMQGKNKGAEDFLVGGRSFGIFFNTGTLTACWVGGVMVIGIPGTLISCGIWNSDFNWGVLVTFGGCSCLLWAGAFYMKKLWELKLLSLGDYYYQRFGKTAGVLATVLMCFTFTVWIGVQVIAFAKVGTSLIGWELEYWIIVSMAVICAYTILGGLWAVCLTDIIQVAIVTLSMIILAPLVVNMVGGWDAMVANIPEGKTDFFPKYHTLPGWGAWMAAWVVIGWGSIASPDLMQRAFSAKTGKVARNSAFFAAILAFSIMGIIIILTFATAQLMEIGQMDSSFLEQDPELLIPMVFRQLMPGPVTVIFLGAVMAAVMSAAATANIALAGVISKNLIADIFVPNMNSRTLMQTSRVVIVFVGIIAAYISIRLPSAFLLTALGFDLILSCMFIPLTLGLYWKKANGWGAVAGMIGGAAFRIIGSGLMNGFSLEGIGSPTETWFVFTLGGPAVSLACMVLVTLCSQKLSRPIHLSVYKEEEVMA